MTEPSGAAGPPSSRPSFVRPLILLLLLGSIIFSVRYFELGQYLEKERLRQAIAAYGYWGPLVYLAVWTLAPPLFLPGLPITLAGGILFGPFWGVVYTTFGATAGASLAFLVARYLARDWVAAKLAGTRLERLDSQMGDQGWKVVAFTRLIPIFPYFLLNYAYGLTRVSFLGFFLATLFGMIPVTTAYVYFSANVLDLLQGKVTQELLIGILLLAAISLVPILYQKFWGKKAGMENGNSADEG
jgi:uncharacterized membrane protein YdjX (TVP38/TMEM64 family)